MILKNVIPKRFGNKKNKGKKDQQKRQGNKKRKEKFLKRSNITCNKKTSKTLSITMRKLPKPIKNTIKKTTQLRRKCYKSILIGENNKISSSNINNIKWSNAF